MLSHTVTCSPMLTPTITYRPVPERTFTYLTYLDIPSHIVTCRHIPSTASHWHRKRQHQRASSGNSAHHLVTIYLTTKQGSMSSDPFKPAHHHRQSTQYDGTNKQTNKQNKTKKKNKKPTTECTTCTHRLDHGVYPHPKGSGGNHSVQTQQQHLGSSPIPQLNEPRSHQLPYIRKRKLFHK